MTQISQFVRRAVQTGSSKLATVCGDRRRTWREFDDRIRRLAGAMHALGFKPGERIGILSLNSDRYLECLFGLSLGGFVFGQHLSRPRNHFIRQSSQFGDFDAVAAICRARFNLTQKSDSSSGFFY